MKPWVSVDKSKMSSVGAALIARVWDTCFGVVPPLRGSINELITNNPGLAPWAMQEFRPYRAHLRLSNQYTLLF